MGKICGRSLSSCIKVSGVLFVKTRSQWHGVAKGVKDFAQNVEQLVDRDHEETSSDHSIDRDQFRSKNHLAEL